MVKVKHDPHLPWYIKFFWGSGVNVDYDLFTDTVMVYGNPTLEEDALLVKKGLIFARTRAWYLMAFFVFGPFVVALAGFIGAFLGAVFMTILEVSFGMMLASYVTCLYFIVKAFREARPYEEALHALWRARKC